MNGGEFFADNVRGAAGVGMKFVVGSRSKLGHRASSSSSQGVKKSLV